MAAIPFISSVAKRLEGKVALITGGASGIGEMTAKVFASHGANVVIADIQDERGRAVANSITQMTPSTYVHCDVTNEHQVKNAVGKAVSTYGKLDIMFNNAGTMDPNKPRIIDSKKEDFERVLSVNVTGVFLGMKHASQAMIPARSGCIISTTSIVSTVAGVATYAYTCSKHAVVGLTKNAAVEFGRFGIRVNSIGPYACATPLASSFFPGMSGEQIEDAFSDAGNLKGMTLKVEDVANAALFLASEEGRYVSGQNLLVDGGFSIFNPNNVFSGIDA